MEMYARRVGEMVAVEDDPVARELLRRAFEKTARWSADFTGFTATLVGHDNGTAHRGWVKVIPPRTVEVSFPEPTMQQWLQQQMASLITHRAYRTFDQADGKYALTLEPEDAHPLGRLVSIHGDGMNSRYRVQGDRICQIQRTMERVKFTINIEDTTTTRGGQVLSTHFSVFFFAVGTGQLTQVESFADEYTEVQGVVLPRSRRVTCAEDGEVSVRAVTLHEHALVRG